MSSGEWRRSARVFVFLSAALMAAGASSPASAAGTWPWPLGAAISLPYGATWTDAAGRSCTHRGADIAGEPGAEVRSCTGGTVAFRGQVPGSAGGTVLAVTVLAPDGLRVTYMPLASAGPAQGEAVEPGHAIGRLAEGGDGSLERPHLHLSVRRGETPLDPASFLGAVAVPVQSPSPQAAPVQTPAPAPTAPTYAPAVPAATSPAAGSAAAPGAASAVSPAASVPAGQGSRGAAARPAIPAAPAVTPATITGGMTGAPAASGPMLSAPALGEWGGRAAHRPPASALPSPQTIWRSLGNLALAGGGVGLRLLAALLAGLGMRALFARSGAFGVAPVPVVAAVRRRPARP